MLRRRDGDVADQPRINREDDPGPGPLSPRAASVRSTHGHCYPYGAIVCDERLRVADQIEAGVPRSAPVCPGW